MDNKITSMETSIEYLINKVKSLKSKSGSKIITNADEMVAERRSRLKTAKNHSEVLKEVSDAHGGNV